MPVDKALKPPGHKNHSLKSQKSKRISSSRYDVDNLFSLFLGYSFISASIQYENHSHYVKSFIAFPIMSGFHWTKVVRALAMLQLGLRPRYN